MGESAELSLQDWRSVWKYPMIACVSRLSWCCARPSFDDKADSRMKTVTIYTKPLCPYCARALSLLKRKGAKIDEIPAAFDPIKREEMLARSNGARTYPQIFIGEIHVGGSDELAALDAAGKLDALLDG